MVQRTTVLVEQKNRAKHASRLAFDEIDDGRDDLAERLPLRDLFEHRPLSNGELGHHDDPHRLAHSPESDSAHARAARAPSRVAASKRLPIINN